MRVEGEEESTKARTPEDKADGDTKELGDSGVDIERVAVNSVHDDRGDGDRSLSL